MRSISKVAANIFTYMKEKGTSFKSTMQQKMWWKEPLATSSRRSSTQTLTKLDSAKEDSKGQVWLKQCTAVPRDQKSITLHHFLPSTAQMWAWQSANRAWKTQQQDFVLALTGKAARFNTRLIQMSNRTNSGPWPALPSFLRNASCWCSRTFLVEMKRFESLI